jgi:hypothetical protein
VDPAWTTEKLVPRFAWSDPDAATLWQARAYDVIGSPGLFNALKPAFLNVFASRDLSRQQLEGLVRHLLQAALCHRQEGSRYDLTPAEAKRALSVGPPEVRHHASWWLLHWAAEGPPAERAEHWRNLFGPLFRDIWPLDAQLRDGHTSKNLISMALVTDTEFPDAVGSIIDFVVPYQLDLLAHSLLLEPEQNALISRYPRAFLRLVNALIDLPIPNDLGELLQKCANADPGCRNEPSYTRLFGLSRR